MTPLQTAITIESQAGRLGYTVGREVAESGSVYLTLHHPRLCDCNDPDCGGECNDRLLRIADHLANVARWSQNVNREPDLDIDPGFQAPAVRRLAEWIGVSADSVPYLKRAATTQRKALAARRVAEAVRQAASRERGAESQRLYDTASPEDQAIADHYRTLRGEQRKNYGYVNFKALRRAGAKCKS